MKKTRAHLNTIVNVSHNGTHVYRINLLTSSAELLEGLGNISKSYVLIQVLWGAQFIISCHKKKLM